MNIFEQASKKKLRFTTSKGMVSSEDLWRMSLPALDKIAKAVNKSLKSESEESFISEKSPKSTDLELQLNIIKHVIKWQMDNKETAAKRAETISRKKLIEDALEASENKELLSKSPEELKKMLAEME